MPELPEVETIVRYLGPEIRGKRILGLKTDTRRLSRDHKNIGEVERAVLRKRIEDVKRIGKNIVFILDRGDALVLHLMLTGRLLLNPKGKVPHARLIMRLSQHTKLVFQDIRKFGRLRLVSSPESLAGKDPLKITFREFQRLLGSRNRIIKAFFLDQRFLAGIGNIYSDEILWEARIHPKRKTGSIVGRELFILYKALKKVLKLAIKKEGTSMRDYRKPDGTAGGYWEIRRVYGREGEKCRRCGVRVKRVRMGGRSAYFCSKCQH